MMWLWLIGGVLLFIFIEVATQLSFAKRRKVSELLNIVAFLLAAWLLTEDEMVVSVLGWILLGVAILLDVARRNALNNSR